jgi:putative ABC transport system substrate-binding protein
MKRRAFITLLGGAAAGWPLAAGAQQTNDRIPHIAYLGALSPTRLDPRQLEQFKAGLAENGLVPDRTIRVPLYPSTPAARKNSGLDASARQARGGL